jgi:hypothetical protein
MEVNGIGYINNDDHYEEVGALEEELAELHEWVKKVEPWLGTSRVATDLMKEDRKICGT